MQPFKKQNIEKKKKKAEKSLEPIKRKEPQKIYSSPVIEAKEAKAEIKKYRMVFP